MPSKTAALLQTLAATPLIPATDAEFYAWLTFMKGEGWTLADLDWLPLPMLLDYTGYITAYRQREAQQLKEQQRQVPSLTPPGRPAFSRPRRHRGRRRRVR